MSLTSATSRVVLVVKRIRWWIRDTKNFSASSQIWKKKSSRFMAIARCGSHRKARRATVNTGKLQTR